MPGHKFDAALNPRLTDYWGSEVYPADQVEVGGGVDYLHAPQAELAQAQHLAAQAVGADRSIFLINGSTVGNLAMLMATAGEGQPVILPRASHRSVYGGLILSGADPVYVPPVYHPQVGFPLAVEVDVVRELLTKYPQAAALHITAPNYYGFLSDVGGLAALAHERGLPLLVDEAHGAHLPYHPALPASAVIAGADVVVQSMHKTLGALTQAAVLHLTGERVNAALLQQVLTLLQSSSPSSLLLASLDAARQQMATQGEALLQRAIEAAQYARACIRDIPGLWCYGDELLGEYGIHSLDPTKLVIRVRDAGWSGVAFMKRLTERHNLQSEFADPQHIICSISIADTAERIDYLLEALGDVAGEGTPSASANGYIPPPPTLPQLALSPRRAYFAPSGRLPLAQAVGEVCAENIIPYPPGIPVLMPGEVIDADTVAYLRYVLRQGINIVGPEDLSLEQVRVIAGR